jgi:cytochrome c553
MRTERAYVAVLALCSFAAVFFMVRSNSLADQTAPGATKDQVTRGEYLITVGGCDDCHSPKLFTTKGPVPDMNKRLSGAPADTKIPAIPAGAISPTAWGALTTNDFTAWAGPWGVSFAANLTPDKNTGLGSWTEAAFINSLRTGKHKGVLRDILPPMPWQNYSKLNDADLKAMFAYFQTLKPVQNKVPDPIPPKR